MNDDWHTGEFDQQPVQPIRPSTRGKRTSAPSSLDKPTDDGATDQDQSHEQTQ